MKNIGIITNVITSYREGFLDKLFLRNDINVTIYCQKAIPGMNLKSIHEKYGDRICIVKNYTVKGEKIGFQKLPIRNILKQNDIIFLDGNPRILSNIFMSIVAAFSKKKFIMWTMGHSYGANPITESIRLKWTSFFKNIFVYTDEEVNYLRQKGFNKHNIRGMNNGLDQSKIDFERKKWNDDSLIEWCKSKNLFNKRIAVSIARLTAKNKFEQVIEAMPNIVKKYPDFIWCVIGAGPEEDKLIKLAEKKEVRENIYFVGALFQESDIAPYLINADIFIHPASIGLSLMHAFGYGLPVVVNNDMFMHGPEYGIFKNGQNGLNFKKDDISDLENKIFSLLENKDFIKEISVRNLELVRTKYNVDVMVERFIAMTKI
ncbi:glycosyltransferase family 4 protein [Elizabethkingia meningoseptica]|uniref:glycosyltransferase family 4 protein n=1 Tax=Elizabethkingia meningoseptica TaxID=238 RepID=UPI003016EDBA